MLSLLTPTTARAIFRASFISERVKMKRNKKFLCTDCNIDTKYEFYFVHTDLWLSVMPSITGMLCIGCLESRLGRQLCAKDFTDAYINDIRFGDRSPRLLDRLRRFL